MVRICYDKDLLLGEDHTFIPASYLRVRGLHSFGYGKFERAKKIHGDHVHPGCMEITVMVGGSQKYAAGKEEFFLHAGDVLFNFADEVHNTGGEPQGVSEFYLLELDTRIVDGFGELRPPFDRLLHEKVVSWDKRMLRISAEDIALCREAFQYFEALITAPEDQESRMRGLAAFLRFLHRLSAAREERQDPNDRMEHILRYIADHIYEQIAIDHLAEMAGMSGSRFKQKFKEKNGLPPREYINREKVMEAKRLLRQGDRSVTEISNQLGFSDSGYFARVFRRFIGCTPSSYQKHQLWEVVDSII